MCWLEADLLDLSVLPLSLLDRVREVFRVTSKCFIKNPFLSRVRRDELLIVYCMFDHSELLLLDWRELDIKSILPSVGIESSSKEIHRFEGLVLLFGLVVFKILLLLLPLCVVRLLQMGVGPPKSDFWTH